MRPFPIRVGLPHQPADYSVAPNLELNEKLASGFEHLGTLLMKLHRLKRLRVNVGNAILADWFSQCLSNALFPKSLTTLHVAANHEPVLQAFPGIQRLELELSRQFGGFLNDGFFFGEYHSTSRETHFRRALRLVPNLQDLQLERQEWTPTALLGLCLPNRRV